MKLFSAVLILIFSFQSFTKADDISEFEIEGLSIGDNILEYFSKNKLEKFKRSYGNDHNGIEVYSNVSKSHERYFNLQVYDGLQVSYVKSSQNYYKIISISGQVWFVDKIDECLKQRDKIITEIENFLGSSILKKDIKYKKRKHYSDKTGKSFTYDATFYLNKENEIRVDCYDWSKEKGYWDHLRVSILTDEYMDLVDRDYNK